MQSNTQGSLQDKFNNFGAAPGAEVWGAIAASLDEDKKRRGVIWWWILGSAAGLALIFSVYRIGYNAGMNEVEQNAPVIAGNVDLENDAPGSGANILDVNQAASPEDNSGAVLSNQEPVLQNEKSLVIETGTQQNQAESTHLNSTNDLILRDMPDDHVLFKQVEAPDGNAMTLVDPMDLSFSKMPLPGVMNITFAGDPLFAALPVATIEKYRKPGQWQVGLNLVTHRNDIGANAKPDAYYENDTTAAGFGNLTADQNVPNSITPHKVVTRRPVLAELTVARSVGRRWGVQSGLGLAFYHTTRFFDVPNNAIYGESAGLESIKTKHLALHIPLHLTFDFIKRRRVECYSGLGINNEFTIWSKATPNYDAQAFNALSENASSTSFDLRYENSAQLSLGFRYCINEKLKLDLRPNAKWYLRGDKGTWLGLSAGLTWSI